MGEEADCTTKFKMAYTFCTSCLAELRAVERRWVQVSQCRVFYVVYVFCLLHLDFWY